MDYRHIKNLGTLDFDEVLFVSEVTALLSLTSETTELKYGFKIFLRNNKALDFEVPSEKLAKSVFKQLTKILLTKT